jgi:cardiolipin synthase A/B
VSEREGPDGEAERAPAPEGSPERGRRVTIGMTTAALLALPILPLAWIGLLHSFRTPATERLGRSRAIDDAPRVDDPHFAAIMTEYAGMPLHGGHEVDLLLNGDGTYPRLWRDLERARASITLQNYFIEPGELSARLFAILCERARAGVDVLFLYDGVGSSVDRGDLDTLGEAGVDVRVFRPILSHRLHLAQKRSHARVVVVDGRVGYTGGFGFADKWMGCGRRPDEWRETSVRFTGPAVRQLQTAFGIAWSETTGTLLTGERFFPAASAPVAGRIRAGLMYSRPTVGSTPAARFVALSLAAARRRLYIASAYFVPMEPVVALLEKKARSGVDVRVLAAGPRTDVATARHAGRARYERLLRAGVRIWEYEPSMMHAKTFVVDGRWCTVGGLNMDNRSTALMDETTLGILDARFARRMEEVFFEDLARSREVVLDEFLRRPLRERAAERAATTISRLL